MWPGFLVVLTGRDVCPSCHHVGREDNGSVWKKQTNGYEKNSIFHYHFSARTPGAMESKRWGEDWIGRFWNRRCQMVKGTVGYRGECFVFGKSWPVEKFQHLGKWQVMAQRKCPSTQHLVFGNTFIYGNQHDQCPLRDHWAVQRYRHEKLIHIETGYGEYEEIMQIIGKTERQFSIYMDWDDTHLAGITTIESA